MPTFLGYQAFQPWVKGDPKITSSSFSEEIVLMAENVWLDR